ncbi:hypothetical protein ACW9KT_13255 [Hymenobacter sp. HD11105]
MKRPLTHRFFSGLLALLVLTASVGLTVQRRTCHMSGRSTSAFTFTPATDACEPVPTVSACCADLLQLREACCDLSTDFHKLNAPAPALLGGKFLPAPAINAWLPTTVWPPFPAAPLLAQAAVRWYASDASPPPRAGRVLLTFGCTLVI